MPFPNDPFIGQENGGDLSTFGFVGYDPADFVAYNPTRWGILFWGFITPNFGATTTGWIFMDEKFFTPGWSLTP